MRFFVGLHHPHRAAEVDAAFISINALRSRKSDFPAGDWVLDSGAFTQISQHGRFLMSVEEYAQAANRWRSCGRQLAVVTQDFMCEPFVLEKTGGSVPAHQQWTIARYDRLIPMIDGYLMPVLQGWSPEDYGRHVLHYGDRLAPGAWVGVGGVCKRNGSGDTAITRHILAAILRERPDLRLHGFGLKITALADADVVDMLYSADSMAWSFAARIEGRNGNDINEALRFIRKIESQAQQLNLRLEETA